MSLYVLGTVELEHLELDQYQPLLGDTRGQNETPDVIELELATGIENTAASAMTDSFEAIPVDSIGIPPLERR